LNNHARQPLVPPSGPLLVISPHLDDAVLSCSALVDREEPATVMTVFSGEPNPPLQTEWDTLTGFQDSAMAMAARRAEDQAALGGTGHQLRYLDLLQIGYSPPPRPESDRRAIAAAVEEWARGRNAGVVALPAGAGRSIGRLRARIGRRIGFRTPILPHPDHLFVRDNAIEVIVRFPTISVLLYEELPYLLDGTADRQVLSAAKRWGQDAIPCSVEVDRQRKAVRVAAYASQVPHLLEKGQRLDAAESLPPRERYWYLTPD